MKFVTEVKKEVVELNEVYSFATTEKDVTVLVFKGVDNQGLKIILASTGTNLVLKDSRCFFRVTECAGTIFKLNGLEFTLKLVNSNNTSTYNSTESYIEVTLI